MPNIIVIGASAGGIEPLRKIVQALPSDLQAALFIVMHLSPINPSVLPNILQSSARIALVPLKTASPSCPRGHM